MDIIDVLVSLALNPKGQISTYAAQAQQAVTNANNAVATATEAATAAESALEQFADVTTMVDNEIDKLLLSMTSTTDSSVVATNLVTTYPDNTTNTINNLIKYYTTTGNNEDGTMTQKAITAAIANGQGGGGTTNLGTENAGHVVIVGEDGNITAGEMTEEYMISAIGTPNGYTPTSGALGLEIDYENKNCARIEASKYYNRGADFDKYSMYGGRMKCNVADDGTINAFYGQTGYTEDGSNGQVMIYQPKFYYKREIIKLNDAAIRKEAIYISAVPQTDFKIHPLFVAEDGSELDYVLLSTYEGCAYDVSLETYDLNDSSNINFLEDKLSSIANAKPISGVNKALNVINAEALAKHRGSGWHITNMAAESALQWLQIIELGTLNGQDAIGNGLSNLPNTNNTNCSCITGSTASLGNGTGVAVSSTQEVNGVYATYTEEGRTAVCYRGMENPWGNLWRMVGGTVLDGDGTKDGGIAYICTDFNYSAGAPGANYGNVSFTVPSIYNYISAFGYDPLYDWVFIPTECRDANSALPVGDWIWTNPNLNTTNLTLMGGRWNFTDKNGIFAYAFDRGIDYYYGTCGARLMYIPTKNSIYISNISKWSALMG